MKNYNKMLIMCAYFYLAWANGLLGNVWIPQIEMVSTSQERSSYSRDYHHCFGPNSFLVVIYI